MPEVVSMHEDTELKVIAWSCVLGVRWYDIPALQSIARYRALQARHLKLLDGNKAIVVSSSDASAERLNFDSGLRQAVEDVLRDGQSALFGMAQIVSGEGFGAASVRSVLSGIQLAVRPDYPVQLFGDSKSATPWLEEILLEAGRPDLAREIGAVLLPELERGRA